MRLMQLPTITVENSQRWAINEDQVLSDLCQVTSEGQFKVTWTNLQYEIKYLETVQILRCRVKV